MDNANQVLAAGVPEGMPTTYTALAAFGGVPLSTLYHRARGRQSMAAKGQGQQYLHPCEEKAVVEFILQMHRLGQPVRMKHVRYIAFSATRHRPMAERPIKPPGVNWAKGLEKRHPELIAKKVRALDWNRYNVYEKIEHWFEVMKAELENTTVLPCNTYNMDEIGVMLSMHGAVKVLVARDDRHGCRGARVKRTMVTAVECVSADGRCLDPMIIWPASTHRSNWTTFPTPGWTYACSDTGFTDSYISLQWLQRVFDSQTKERANGQPRMLIWDGFETHETLEILEFCFENEIILCRLPSHTSHKLQPCDVAVFGPLKSAYRDEVDRMERGGMNTIGKQHFTYLYSPARKRAMNKRNILAGWRASGLFPFNPHRVLADTPRTPAAQMTSQVVEAIPRPPRYEALATPTTPVTVEALESLLGMIALVPDTEPNRQHRQRLLSKVANAAHTSFARTALLQAQNRFLTKMNDESKTRRSTKSDILGKARVMTYEDLEKARAERALKKQSKAKAKGKRGRKRKAATTEAAETAAEATYVNEVSQPAMLLMQPTEAACLMERTDRERWSVPVARMW